MNSQVAGVSGFYLSEIALSSLVLFNDILKISIKQDSIRAAPSGVFLHGPGRFGIHSEHMPEDFPFFWLLLRNSGDKEA